jgi:hypothetical protein
LTDFDTSFIRNRSVGKTTVVFDGLVPPVVGNTGVVLGPPVVGDVGAGRVPPVVGLEPGGGAGGVVGGVDGGGVWAYRAEAATSVADVKQWMSRMGTSIPGNRDGREAGVNEMGRNLRAGSGERDAP